MEGGDGFLQEQCYSVGFFGFLFFLRKSPAEHFCANSLAHLGGILLGNILNGITLYHVLC